MAVFLKQRAYDHIRQKLLSGELAGGARLSNRALAAEIGISFIPIREAISQLVSEGLVEHRPGVGSFVVQPSRQEIEDLYDIREAIECHAVRRAVERISQGELATLEQCNAVIGDAIRGSESGLSWSTALADECLRADAKLHTVLLQAAGNRRIVDVIEELRMMTRLFTSSWKFSSPVEDLERTFEEHANLIQAIRDGDATRAQDRLREHIRQAGAEAIEAFERLESERATNRNHELQEEQP